ncbi:MAG: RNA polymerase sigma factor [Clostridia bacterium]|nr:RNA polymerase sigma factor [Clostridia bacterium]
MRLRNSNDIHKVLSSYSAMVYRLAFARTNNHSDAEDISQEVFISLVHKNPNFEAEQDRKAWLIRVTVNKANSLWRTPWRRKVELRAEIENNHAIKADTSEIQEALAALNGDDRSLIFLHYFEGFKTDEIARILERKPDAVRKQLSRARTRMKQMLDKGVSE